MNTISKEKFKDMLFYGAENLRKQVDTINALNVFPVPDGDTGTNMNMTIQTGIKSVNSNVESIKNLTKELSKGMLMGARGNSGVILSQFFRGIANELEMTDEMTVEDFQKALKQGKKKAYESVIKAVEGTILTVIKDMSEYKPVENNVDEYFENLLKVGNKSLINTPELLPVLKEAEVVDSGGAGLIAIFEGMNACLQGKELEISHLLDFDTYRKTEEFPMDINDIIYGYCTEMLINLKKEIKIANVRNKLETFGDSIVAIEDDGILKVHVHTENPIDVFEYGKTLGDFVNVKSENMRIQAIEASNQKELKENGLVVVASSVEMAEKFKEIQDIEIIVGGQTLNPSTEDITKAIRRTGAKNVLVFPNNSNIIMSAQTAKDLIEDINVEVIKTKYMSQAMEALINYDVNLDIQTNKKNLEKIIKNIVNIEVTKSIKDTKVNNIVIKKDDYLVIKNGVIVDALNNEENLINSIIKNLEIENLEVINVFVGIDGDKKITERFGKKIEEIDEFLDIEIYNTKQPVYHYLIAGIK